MTDDRQKTPSPGGVKIVSIVLFPHPISAYHDVSASGPGLGPQGLQAAICHLSGIADREKGAKKPESYL